MPPLLGQFCFLTTVAFLFPPPQSKAKPIVDLGNCLPVGEKVEGNVMIIISKGGKVNRVWQEPRTASAVLMVLLLTAYKTLAVSLHSSKWKHDGKIFYFSPATDWGWWQWCLKCIVQSSSAWPGRLARSLRDFSFSLAMLCNGVLHLSCTKSHKTTRRSEMYKPRQAPGKLGGGGVEEGRCKILLRHNSQELLKSLNFYK